MDCRMKAKVTAFVEGLAREHQAELAAAGTLVELEELTCQLGDEVTRALTERELIRRGEEQRHRETACPTCGTNCLPDHEPEPTVLKGMRGELAYPQAKYFCNRCRRSFFPSGGAVGHPAAE
jgi:hypothetical protein